VTSHDGRHQLEAGALDRSSQAISDTQESSAAGEGNSDVGRQVLSSTRQQMSSKTVPAATTQY